MYHTTSATLGTMRVAAENLRVSGHADAADYAEQKATEEAGHDVLALRDLAGLGLDAEQIVKDIQPPMALALVSEFEEMARSWPYGVFGYAFALEAVALLRTQEMIDEAQAFSDVDVTRCLRTHSGVGADPHHVAELVDFIIGLPAEAKRDVYKGVYVTGEIFRRYEKVRG